MTNLKINHLAAITCIVLLHVLGFLWYGPLFGEKWMDMVGIDMQAMEANPPGAGLWITNFIACAAPVYLFAWLFTQLNVTTGIRGAAIVFIVTLCVHHLPVMSGNMFADEPYGFAWITGGFSLVAFSLSGFILGAWTKTKA